MENLTTEVNNHMTSLALSFNNVNFSPVQHEQQIWLTASELSKALGYAKSDAVAQVYERNKDEFNQSMTLTLKLSVKGFGNGNSEKDTRIFSLRGCHLIAMFSKTAIAKQFRKWVLDVLDREVLNQNIKSRQTITPEQKDTLHKIIDHKVNGNQGLRAQVWTRHNRHFKINSYHELLKLHFEDSVKYLLEMEVKQKAESSVDAKINMHNIQGLAIHMIWVHKWWREFGEAIRVISPRMAGAVNDHFVDGVCFAYNFIDKDLRLAIDEDVKYYPWHLNYAERKAIEYKSK